jgi:hypothetical protein
MSEISIKFVLEKYQGIPENNNYIDKWGNDLLQDRSQTLRHANILGHLVHLRSNDNLSGALVNICSIHETLNLLKQIEQKGGSCVRFERTNGLSPQLRVGLCSSQLPISLQTKIIIKFQTIPHLT